METLCYFSEAEDKRFTDLVIRYNSMDDDNEEKLHLENRIKERTMILLYLIPQRNMYLGEEEAGGFFLEIQKDIESIISSFRITGATYNSYLQQTCRYRCMRYMRRQKKKDSLENALIFSDMTIHDEEYLDTASAVSESVTPYETEDWSDDIDRMDLGELSMHIIMQRSEEKCREETIAELELATHLRKARTRRQFLEFLLALPCTETQGFIAGVSRLLHTDYKTVAKFYALRHDALMNEHGDEIRFLEELAGRHWKILAKIGTATVNADTPEEKAIMIDRYLKMKRVYERRLSDLMKARSGLTHYTISTLLGVSRPMVSADIKKMKMLLNHFMDDM